MLPEITQKSPLHLQEERSKDYTFDEDGNAVDYFNIYKKKMYDIAHSKFDEEKDVHFFSYLDRLVNAEVYRQKERIDGQGILREFVTDHSSLTYVKRRNEQIKRWDTAKKKRIERGLPGTPPENDFQSLKEEISKHKQEKVVVPQRTFVPEIEATSHTTSAKQESSKNYIVKQRFGKMRNYRPPWQDPNPIKYGGKFGMQHLKEMVDTGYIKGKAGHDKRVEAERRAAMTEEEIAEEDRLKEEEKLRELQNMKKIADMDEEKNFDAQKPLEPHERSFLIQPEKKSNKARMPPIFTGSEQMPTNLGKRAQSIQPYRKSRAPSGFEQSTNSGFHSNSSKRNLPPALQLDDKMDINTIDQQQSKENLHGTKEPPSMFGKRSMSMAAPTMLSPSVQKSSLMEKIKSKQTLDPEQQKLRSALEQFKQSLGNQNSSTTLLNKMQSEYSSIRQANEKNDARYNQNIQSIKKQVMEPNQQILNPPIEEHYQHKKFKGEENIEATVKLSFAFEELQKDPKRLEQAMGIKRNKVKFQYRPKHLQEHSPSEDKLQIFDTLTKDIKSVRSLKKRGSTIDHSEAATAHGMLPRNPSNLSNKTIQTVKEKEQFNKIWDDPFFVVFMTDGASMSDKKAKSIRIDISKYVRKYQIKPPKFIASLPQKYLKSQAVFFERAYLELLEFCSDKLKPEPLEEGEEAIFKTMYTVSGDRIATIEQLQDLILDRMNEQMYGGSPRERMMINNNSNLQFSLPKLKQPFSSQYLSPQKTADRIQPVSVSPSAGDLKKINKVKKAQFISYSPSVERIEGGINFQSSQSQLSLGNPPKIKPPLILLSLSTDQADFKGLELEKANFTTEELRKVHAAEVKAKMKSMKGQWGSQQFLNWIESNIDSGVSETHNMQKVLEKDTKMEYSLKNDQYRAKIGRKLGGTVDIMKPVYQGGAINNTQRFLQPVAEEGALSQLREKFLGKTERKGSLAEHAHHRFSSLQLNDLEVASIAGQLPGMNQQSHQYLAQSGSRFSLGEKSLRDGSAQKSRGGEPGVIKSASNKKWNEDFVGRVEQLKKSFIQKTMTTKAARQKGISPSKKNFEMLSNMQSQTSLHTERAPPNLDHLVPGGVLPQNMMKLAGNFNIALSGTEDRVKLQENLVEASKVKVKKKKHVSKNIPHLQMQKEKVHKRPKLSIEEATVIGSQYSLDPSTILELQTEFECMKEMTKVKERADDGHWKDFQKSPTSVEHSHSMDEADDEQQFAPKQDGIPAHIFIKAFQPLKEKHPHVQDKILSAVGIVTKKKGTLVEWEKFLLLQAILKFDSASLGQFVEFWMKFFNLYNQPEIPKSDIMVDLELLARGVYTTTSTLVSEQFALNFYQVLKNNGCCFRATNGTEMINMVAFKKKLLLQEIDVKELNMLLTQKMDHIEAPEDTRDDF